MNPRIRELAFECARQLDWNPPSDPKEYTFSSAGLEKFAELIVRECVYVSEGYFGFKDHTPGTAIANEIKQHFGVEE